MASADILVVDDEPDIGSLLKEILEDEGYDVRVADNGEQARRLRSERRPDLVLLDIWMPDVDGVSLLKEWKAENRQPVPVIMMSGHGTVETAVEATRLGAFDYIEKPLSLGRLLITIRRALAGRREAGPGPRLPSAEGPVGRSAAMESLRQKARKLAGHSANVLIRGEPGTDRIAVARYLHRLSERCNAPLVEARVEALNFDAAATELFGREDEELIHPGLFERADGGTLFLDDIGELDATTQTRLLGVLESGSFFRAGGTDPVKVDARLVAATRYDLEERVREGRFRSELLFQLNVVPIDVPPLRDHLEDIPELVNAYIAHFVDRERLPYRAFTVAAQNRLRQYPWPGNDRELRNIVQRLLITGEGPEVEPEEVDAALGDYSGEPLADDPGRITELPLRQAREQFERRYFEQLLERLDGNMSQVAQHAGIERTHLYRKLRGLGIDVRRR